MVNGFFDTVDHLHHRTDAVGCCLLLRNSHSTAAGLQPWPLHRVGGAIELHHLQTSPPLVYVGLIPRVRSTQVPPMVPYRHEPSVVEQQTCRSALRAHDLAMTWLSLVPSGFMSVSSTRHQSSNSSLVASGLSCVQTQRPGLKEPYLHRPGKKCAHLPFPISVRLCQFVFRRPRRL